MNEDCQNLSCPTPANAVQEYLNQYSLEGTVIGNPLVQRTINGKTVSIPANTFTVSVSPDTSFPINVQGCQSLISIPVPAGATFATIQALARQAVELAAEQQAVCDATGSTPVNPQPPARFLNQERIFDPACSSGTFIILGSLPVFVSRSGELVVLSPGIFSSDVSQSDANHRADLYLNGLINSFLLNGTAFCGCADPDIITTVSSDFIIPNDGDTVTIKVADSSAFFANPTQDQLNGAWYCVSRLYNAVSLMWFSVDSITDSTHIVARSFSAISAGDTIGSGYKIVNSTNPQISASNILPASVGIQDIATFSSKMVNCGSCTINDLGTVWDGVFPFRTSNSPGGIFDTFIYSLQSASVFTINKIVLKTPFFTDNVDIAYITGGGGITLCVLSIACDDGTVLWNGTKFSGNDPTGIYYFANGCSSGVRCITVA